MNLQQQTAQETVQKPPEQPLAPKTPRIQLREREKLAQFLASTETVRAKIAVVYRILEMAIQREISSFQARVLVHAVTSGQHDFKSLDCRYAELTKTEPHNVSNTLHSYRRRSRVVTGIISEVEKDIFAFAEPQYLDTPRGKRAREFLANCIEFFRNIGDRNLFSIFLKGPTPSPEVARVVAKVIQPILDATWPKELEVTAPHAAILERFLEQKETGTFTSMRSFSVSLELDQTGVAKALQGKGKYLGIIEKINQGAQRILFAEYEQLKDAIEALAKQKSITQAQGAVVRAALRAVLIAQNVETDSAKQVLQCRYERKISGESVRLIDVAEALNMKVARVSSAWARSTDQRGIEEMINYRLQNLPVEEKRVITDFYFPYEKNAYRSLLKKLARTETSEPNEILTKERLSAVVEAIAQELGKSCGRLPVVRQQEGKQVFTRVLQPYDVVKILRSYFVESAGNTVKLREQLTSVLESQSELAIGDKALRNCLFGRKEKAVRVSGGIKRLVNGCKGIKREIARLSAVEDTAVLTSEDIPDFMNRAKILNWASRVVRSEDPQERIRLVAIFCATKPHSAREIVSGAVSCIEKQGFQQYLPFYRQLKQCLAVSSLFISDRQFVHELEALEKTFEASSTFKVKPLLFTACARGVKVSSCVKFLHHVHERERWATGLSTLEDVAQLAYGAQSTSLSRKELIYIRKVYDTFLCEAFGSVLAPSQFQEIRSDFAQILERAHQVRLEQNAEQKKASLLVESFFRQYKIEKVIGRFCAHLLQRPSNPLGLPYNAMFEVANDSVFDAARRYDPEALIAAGKPKASFNTFAIATIRWCAVNAAKKHASELLKAPVHLEDRFGSSDEGREVGNFIVINADQRNDLEQEIKTEKILKMINKLNPVARRILQLRFSLTKDEVEFQGESPSLDEIARTIKQEGLVDRVVSRERIRQIIEGSLIKIRALVYTSSVEKWQEYFNDITNRERPEPFYTEADHGEVSIGDQFKFMLYPHEIGRGIAYDIDKVFQLNRREHEVIIRARDMKTLKELGVYEIMISNNRVCSCDRIN